MEDLLHYESSSDEDEQKTIKSNPPMLKTVNYYSHEAKQDGKQIKNSSYLTNQILLNTKYLKKTTTKKNKYLNKITTIISDNCIPKIGFTPNTKNLVEQANKDPLLNDKNVRLNVNSKKKHQITWLIQDALMKRLQDKNK